jgi:cyclophilin family peptidyl-prolyl cis-trans isomerase
MTSVHRATPGRRTLRLAALVATAALALAACSSAATPTPTFPAIVPPTPTPVPTPTPTPDPNAPATPDLASCPKSADQIPALKAGETRTVTIQTDLGNIVTEVSGDLAPMAAGNFVALAECGFYDGVVFHRVVPGFVIQGGDGQHGKKSAMNSGRVGTGGPGYSFADEPFGGDYYRGAVAMANAGPNTNGSQFFICLKDLSGHLPKNYTIFGQVTKGLDVVDVIAAEPTGPKDLPRDPVAMETVTIVEEA